ADDYVTKPFSAVELAARVRAALRRSQSYPIDGTFCCGEMVIDFARQRVTVAGKEVELTATEYRLVTYLARNGGRVLTPDQILEKVWGEAYVGEVNLLQVNMARLRRKLGDDPRNPRFILTRSGIGYLMATEE
ncbi:MAG: response regulator transcription factor, partial [Dehalococcoidia bacterium]|nr:response regulator transcription factor [Dehalococcoidia bacterium]